MKLANRSSGIVAAAASITLLGGMVAHAEPSSEAGAQFHVESLASGDIEASAESVVLQDLLALEAHAQVESSPNAYELQDLVTLADDQGISLDEAVTRFGWRDNFAGAVDVMREAFPEDFAGAEIEGADSAWIAFSSEVPGAARDYFENLTGPLADIDIRLEAQAGFSEYELVEAIEDLHFSVYENPAITDVTTTFDYGTRTFSIIASSNPRARAAAGVVADRAAASTPLIDTTVAVEVRVGEVLGGFDASNAHLGGERLNATSGFCSSGFATRDTSSTAGTRGMTTAGHCPNTLRDDGVNLPFVRAHEGTHGDFQLHRGSQTLSNRFYAGSATVTETNPRNVTAVRAPVVGQRLCKNGAAGHQDCGDVRRLNVCRGAFCNLVEMGSRLAAPGDSGGPVFTGNTAVGIHHGWHYAPMAPFSRDLFSRADRMPTAIRAHVATN